MKALRLLALALLLAACSDHGPTASTPVQQGQVATPAPAAAPASSVQADQDDDTQTLADRDLANRKARRGPFGP